MLRALYSITVAMLLASHAASGLAQHGALDAETLFERLSPSVWVVFAGVDKAIKQGSAVVIDEEVLVTNCHVVDKAERIEVANGTQELRATLQYADPERDLCFLSVPRLKAPAVQIGDPHALRVGARLYALGNPRGLELTLSDGLLSAFRRNARGEVQRLQISVPISPGSSGGGLFNVYGQLVGITTSGLRESQSLNFAMPSHFLLEVPMRTAGVRSTLVVHAPPKAPERAALPPFAPTSIVAAAPAVVSPPVLSAPATPAPATPAPVTPLRPWPLQPHPPRSRRRELQFLRHPLSSPPYRHRSRSLLPPVLRSHALKLLYRPPTYQRNRYRRGSY